MVDSVEVDSVLFDIVDSVEGPWLVHPATRTQDATSVNQVRLLISDHKTYQEP
jgi:hypothetical protein